MPKNKKSEVVHGRPGSLNALQRELHQQSAARDPRWEFTLPAAPVPLRAIFAPVIAGEEILDSLTDKLTKTLPFTPLPPAQLRLGHILSLREVKFAQAIAPPVRHKEIDESNGVFR